METSLYFFFYIDMGSLAHKGFLPCHRFIFFQTYFFIKILFTADENDFELFNKKAPEKQREA